MKNNLFLAVENIQIKNILKNNDLVSLKFTINKLTKIIDFINQELQGPLISTIKKQLPNFTFDFHRNCDFKINNLKNTDFLQGKNLPVIVTINENNKIKATLFLQLK